MSQRNAGIFAALAAFVLAATGSVAGAATVTADGFVKDEPNWHSAGYGDIGFAFFMTDNANNPSVGSDRMFTGGEVYEQTDGSRSGTIDVDKLTSNENAGDNTGGDNGDSGDEPLEDPSDGMFSPGDFHDAIDNTDDTLHDVVSLTFQSGAPSQARIGVLVGAAEAQEFGQEADFPDDVGVGGVSQAVDQPADSEPEVVRADWYFFNATDIASGETINVAASRIGIDRHRFNPINGVALSVIPEPASLTLLAPAGLLALRRRR